MSLLKKKKNEGKDFRQQLKEFAESSGLNEKIEPLAEKYQELTAEQKRLTQAAAALGVLALYLFFVLSPQWNDINKLKKRTDETRGIVQQVVRDKESETHTVEASEETNRRYEQLQKKVLNASSLPTYLDSLSRMAKQSDLTIESLKPIRADRVNEIDGKDLPEGYEFAGYEILVRGDFHSMGHFVSKVESMETFTGVRDVEVFHERESEPDSHLLRLVVIVLIADEAL